LQAEALQTKQVQQQNAQMMKMIAKIQQDGGRVSTRWDDLFIAGWYETNTHSLASWTPAIISSVCTVPSCAV